MGDPLSDPRAQRLLSADTGEIGSLAGTFRTVAHQAQTAAAGLRGAQGDARWTGGAADAFRSQVGKLPGDLEKVQNSYGEVATALDGYESQLGPIQTQFRSLATQLSGAQSSLTTAQGQQSQAKTSLSTATAAPHATAGTTAVVNAHTALQSANGAVGRLQDQVSGLQGRGFHLLDEFDTIRGQARSTVSSAAGIAPSHSWLSGALHDIGNFMDGAGHFFAGIGKGVYDAAKSLPSDVANVVEHPTNLRDWSKLGEDVGTVAGAVALVAAVIICPADAIGFEAVADVAEAAEAGGEAVSTYSLVGKTGADSGLVLEHKGSISTVESDVVGVVANKIKPGEGGAEADVEHLAGKSDGLENFALSRALGATPKQAYADLSDEQRSFLSKSLTKLSDPGRLSYMRSSTAEQLEQAETHLTQVKAVNTIGHFGADKGREALTPEPDSAGCAAG
jgi:uncharacterized protein YukE